MKPIRNKEAKVFLSDIIESFNKIEKYTGNLSFDDFVKDQKTIDAVIRNFEVIGEATKNIPEIVKSKYPNVPWRKMAGMRDRVIHEYFGVNLKIVWRTIKENIPQLKPLIKKILDELEE